MPPALPFALSRPDPRAHTLDPSAPTRWTADISGRTIPQSAPSDRFRTVCRIAWQAQAPFPLAMPCNAALCRLSGPGVCGPRSPSLIMAFRSWSSRLSRMHSDDCRSDCPKCGPIGTTKDSPDCRGRGESTGTTGVMVSHGRRRFGAAYEYRRCSLPDQRPRHDSEPHL